MSSIIERARSWKRVTWLTITGVLLLPALIAGLFIAALHNPTGRLDSMTAAIVNEDEPVTIDGQYIPLGRQLGAGLVAGSAELDSNITWVISNVEDAAAGLAEGRYAATVTIPAEFSAAATSASRNLGGEDVLPQRAKIQVVTAPNGRVADELILTQLASAAATAMGSALTETTFENLLVGFSTLSDRLGSAADGADQLADGAGAAANGTAELADGIRGIAGGAQAIASGNKDLAAGARQLAKGVADLATGLSELANEIAQIPAMPAGVVDDLRELADNAPALQSSLDAMNAEFNQLVTDCLSEGGSAAFCDRLTAIAATTDGVFPALSGVLAQADTLADAAEGLAQFGPALTAALNQSAGGATQLSSGMSDLADGAEQLASGASRLSQGATAASTGASDLSDGMTSLADGVTTLADGLSQAADAVPAFSEGEVGQLVAVLNDPIEIAGANTSLTVPAAIPLLTSATLWFGSLATFIVLRPTPRRALVSRGTSARLAWRSFFPAAAVGAGQGVLVAIIAQWFAQYSSADFWAYLAVASLTGVVFAAINQALVGVLAGFGRWISSVVGVLAVATGLVSTSPVWLTQFGSVLPTAAASSALMNPGAAAIVALFIWGVLAFAVTTLAVLARRSTNYAAVVSVTG
jgi:putative membrane protein